MTNFAQVLEAVEIGQPICFGDDDWMTIPWQSRPKTLFDKVIDICMLSPAFVTKEKSLKCATPDQVLPHAVGITSDIAALINKFDEFYIMFMKPNDGTQLFWEKNQIQAGYVEDGDDESTSVLSFKPQLCFTDLDTASILFMYCKSPICKIPAHPESVH